MNQGQISHFILIGILILSVLIFMITSRQTTTDYSYLGSIENAVVIRSIVEPCLKLSTEDAVQFVGFTSLVYPVQQEFEEVLGIPVPYMVQKNQYMPRTLQDTETSIGNYVDDVLLDCVKKIDISGVSMKYGVPRTRIHTSGAKIVVELFLPVHADANGVAVAVDEFSTEVDFDLNGMQDIVGSVLDALNQSAPLFPSGRISYLSYQKKFYVEEISLSSNSSLIVIHLPQKVRNHPSIVQFMVRT